MPQISPLSWLIIPFFFFFFFFLLSIGFWWFSKGLFEFSSDKVLSENLFFWKW